MCTGNDSVTSGVTQSTAPGTDDILQEHIQDDDQPLRKRRRYNVPLMFINVVYHSLRQR